MAGDTTRWISLVEVRPEPGNDIFDGAPGAFSHVLCLATNAVEYRRKVGEFFRGLSLEVMGYDGIEPLEQRQRYGSVSDEILDLAAHLSESSPVLYNTFYVYESEPE